MFIAFRWSVIPLKRNLPPAGLYTVLRMVSPMDGLSKYSTQTSLRREDYKQAFQKRMELVKDFALSHRGTFTQIDTNYQQQSVGHHLSSGNQSSEGNKNSQGGGHQ